MNLNIPTWHSDASPYNETMTNQPTRSTRHFPWAAERPSIETQREALRQFLKQPIPADIPDEVVEKDYNRYLGRIVTKNIAERNDFISQEPSDYFQENPDVSPGAMALFSFYEEKASDIYKIINQNDPSLLLTVDNQNPAGVVIDLFSVDSTYNKDKICLKTQQEIQCLSNNMHIESYIEQSKKDWTRSPFYSSKFNTYYKKLEHKKKDRNTMQDVVLPYLNTDPGADKLFLITVDAINNYFMQPQYEPSLQIDIQVPIQDNIGDIECDCNKVEDHPLICAGFNVLQIPNEKIKKILYNLSFINQSQKSEIMKIYFKVLDAYRASYDQLVATIIGEDGNMMYNLGEGGGYYYMDQKNQAGVYMNTLIALVTKASGETIFVPLYKIVIVYPFELSDYYYTFLYVDNDPPANVGKKKSMFTFGTSEPVTADYYSFLAEKIKWYLSKPPGDFSVGRYIGADYSSYNNKKRDEFKNTHKPYKSPPYKSPKFIPPEKTPITSSRLLGGKTRRYKKPRQNKTKKMKRSKKVKRSYKRRKSVKRKAN